MALAYVRRRLIGKQPAPAHLACNPAVLQAITDEGWHELTALDEDARRKHVHWVHVRTESADHIQPASMSKEEFWNHMCKVYKEVYPETANKTQSILFFGMVAEEFHSNSDRPEERDPHKHFAAYTTKQHYWRAVAQRSLQQYRIKLHAACHDGYASMYAYLRCSTPKKPLGELDQTLFFSAEHPTGDLLTRLLTASGASDRANRGKKRNLRDCNGDGGVCGRFRTADLYEMVGKTGVRTADQFQAHAHDMACQGEARLAEYCTIVGTMLQQNLDAAWAVHEAPGRLAAAAPDRICRLRRAAGFACTCDGLWIPGAIRILNLNGDSAIEFGHDVHVALALGAKRGANMALIGPPGIGKSMLFEPLDDIYKACGKPQRDCTFPFADVIDADILLWQEFKYTLKVCAWEDLLNLLCGEKFGIRQPNSKPIQHRNKAPMFYTARTQLTMRSSDLVEMAEYNTAMSERFKLRVWSKPLPMAERRKDFPRCACCFAKFVLEHEQLYHMFSENAVP